MEENDDHLVSIFASQNESDTRFIQTLLEAKGIKTLSSNTDGSSIFGVNNIIFTNEIKILAKDYEEAMHILEQTNLDTAPPEAEQEEFQQNSSAPSAYYQNVFAEIERKGGGFAFTWNWMAFLLGPIWYLFNGMFIKAVVILAVASLLLWLNFPYSDFAVFGVWMFCGLFGNYHMYHRYQNRKAKDLPGPDAR